MKKLTLVVFALFSTFFSCALFASNIDLNQYYSTLHPSSPKNFMHPPTDISVINATSSFIYVVVPGTSVNDYLTPGFNDHIYGSNPNSFSTYIVLQDPYRNTFFADSVCRLAIVTAYGNIGSYRLNIDSDLCN